MPESEAELKSLLMRVKEKGEKDDLKLNIKKTKTMASGPITSWQTDWGKMATVTDFIFLASKITKDSDFSHEIKRHLLLGRKTMTLCNPMDCSLPGSSVHGIFQAIVLEWIAISFSRGIFLTQGSNPGLPHCRQMFYRLSHQGSPDKLTDKHRTKKQKHLFATKIHIVNTMVYLVVK